MTVAARGDLSSPVVRVRPILAYLATIAALDVAIHVIWDPEQTGSVVGAIGTLMSRGLLLGTILAVALLPGATLTLHLAARLRAANPGTRALLGGASWIAWYLAVALAVIVAGTIGLWPEGFAVVLVSVAGAGGLFGVLAVGVSPTQPSRAVTLLGVLVAAAIIVGCILTVGWWGGPA